MQFLVLFALVWCCSAEFVVNPYSYFGAHHRQEVRLAGGHVVGHYSYIDSNGEPVVTFYNAGPQGFHVQANNLPVAPVDTNEPVDYTPEVAEARNAFLKLHEEAKSSRTKRQVTLPYSFHPVPTFTKTTVERKQFQPVDAATPAATTQLKLTTTQHEVAIPTLQYQQPLITFNPILHTGVTPAEVKPVVYSVPSSATPYAHFPNHAFFPYNPFFSNFPAPTKN